jgi:uncharacterized protein YkwD
MSFTVRFPMSDTFASNFIQQMVQELNLARRNPKSYIPIVQSYGETYPTADVREAINYLNTVQPCTNTLSLNNGLTMIAQNWVRTQGPSGTTGHGPFENRVQTFNYQSIGENLAYGLTSPRDIIAAWIIDTNVPDRGHRHALFDCIYDETGIAYGTHTRYRNMVSNLYAKQLGKVGVRRLNIGPWHPSVMSK